MESKTNSIAIYDASNREQALLSGIWATSILAAGASMNEGTWMSAASQLAIGCTVGLFTAAGIYVFLRDCWARWRTRQTVEVPVPGLEGGRSRLSRGNVIRPTRFPGNRALPLQGANASSLLPGCAGSS